MESFPPLHMATPEGAGESYHIIILPFKVLHTKERMIAVSSILVELYKGNIGFDSWNYGKDSPFVKAAQKKMESMTALAETLDDSQKELLDGYIEAQGDIEAITRYDTYVASLKFGILLILEVLSKGGAENE